MAILMRVRGLQLRLGRRPMAGWKLQTRRPAVGAGIWLKVVL